MTDPTELQAPWRTHGDCAGILDAEGESIARVYWGAGQPERYRATARLMAAAPELLAAAEIVLDWAEINGLSGPNTAPLASAVAKAKDITTPDTD